MNKTLLLRIACFDILLTAAFIVANGFYANGTKTQSLSTSVLLLAILLFVSIFVLAFLMLRLPIGKAGTPINTSSHGSASSRSTFSHRVWIAHFFLLTLSWMLCLLTYYPGVGMNDGLNVLMGRLSSANQFPIYYCIYVVILGKLGNLFGSLQYAVALYSVLQILMTAAICAGILSFLWEIASSRIIRCLASAYYILQPVLAIYSISMLKDTVFSSLLVLYGILLFQIGECSHYALQNSHQNNSSPRADHRMLYFCFTAVSILVSVLRSNGIYIIIVCLFVLFLCRINRRQILITSLAVLLVNASGSVIMQHYNVRHNASETLGIPIQQVCAVVATGGTISDQEKELLRSYIEPDRIPELYNPGCADPVKWSSSFDRRYLNAHSSEFLSLWAKLLLKNPGIYIQAYLQETYWFWAPIQQGGIQMFDTIEEISDNDYLAEFLTQNGIHDAPILRGTAGTILKHFYQSGSYFLREGVCFWIMLFSIMLAWCRKWKLRQILPFYLPQILAWLTIMVSTPINNSFRYVLFYAYALPVYLLFMTHESA